jgi:hypothetical protein
LVYKEEARDGLYDLRQPPPNRKGANSRPNEGTINLKQVKMNSFSTFQHTQAEAIQLTSPNHFVIFFKAVAAMMMSMYMRMRMQ